MTLSNNFLIITIWRFS